MPTAPVAPAAAAAKAAAPANPKALPPALEKALSRVTEISSLPEITTRIVQVVEDPRATAHDMHELVKSDPALATKILKVVNSAFYGLPSQISSLDRAIVMLGLSAVKNIALAASLTRLFKSDTISAQFEAKDLWKHSIAVGVGAKTIADKVRFAQEEAFVGGLVADVGLLAMQQIFPEKMAEVADTCSANPQDYRALETKIIGADHEQFGDALANRWKFPPMLRQCIAYHHDPQALKPEFKRLVSILYIADTICSQNQIGYWLPGGVQELTQDLLDCVGLSAEGLQQVADVLPERISEAEGIFGEAQT
ncbi:MAG: HDOD domain-containing protein [Phycisphaerae bacterium]|nr:HDOD domain-containing protein [Phycisphaerae bacterium]